MKLSPLYDRAVPPIDGYDGFEVKVLLNPSAETFDDFVYGGFSASENESALMTTLRQLIADATTGDEDRATYSTRLADLESEIVERQARMGRALHGFYGQTPARTVTVDDAEVSIDFTSPEAALTTAEDKRLPMEIATWLTLLPTATVEHRREVMRSKLAASFKAGRP